MVAVDIHDKADLIKKYVKEGGFTFPIAMDGGDLWTRFGVSGCPANFVLDPQGKIVFRSTGFDEKALRGALNSLGVK